MTDLMDKSNHVPNGEWTNGAQVIPPWSYKQKHYNIGNLHIYGYYAYDA